MGSGRTTTTSGFVSNLQFDIHFRRPLRESSDECASGISIRLEARVQDTRLSLDAHLRSCKPAQATTKRDGSRVAGATSTKV